MSGDRSSYGTGSEGSTGGQEAAAPRSAWPQGAEGHVGLGTTAEHVAQGKEAGAPGPQVPEDCKAVSSQGHTEPGPDTSGAACEAWRQPLG